LKERKRRQRPRTLPLFLREFWRRRALLATDGVSDGGADAGYEVGVEASGGHIGVVVDVVDVSLGADKEVVPEVVAETSGEVFHKVVRAGVVDAAGEIAAGDHSREVEAGAGRANAGHEVEAKFLSNFRLVECVYVRQDRAIALVSVVAGPVIPPGGLKVKAEAAIVVYDIGAHAEISSALFRQFGERLRTVAGVGLHQGATADHNVGLLGGGKMGQEQESENVCEKR